MASRTFNAGVTLTIDSITETSEVFVEIEDCYFDEGTNNVVKKKKAALAEDDPNDARDSWISGTVAALDRETNMVRVQCDFREGSPFSQKVRRSTM